MFLKSIMFLYTIYSFYHWLLVFSHVNTLICLSALQFVDAWVICSFELYIMNFKYMYSSEHKEAFLWGSCLDLACVICLPYRFTRYGQLLTKVIYTVYTPASKVWKSLSYQHLVLSHYWFLPFHSLVSCILWF